MSEHPATFNAAILAVLDSLLPEEGIILDPFAGVGGVHLLKHDGNSRLTIGVEIEQEWADENEWTFQGSALDLPYLSTGEQDFKGFDAIVTSPTYGNRMADQYDGRDGSKRATYRIALGHDLHEDNSGSLQWSNDLVKGLPYKEFHDKAWAEAVRVLAFGGHFLLNIKDHIRGGERMFVSDWHVGNLVNKGLICVNRIEVQSPGMRFGANGNARIDYEEVVHLIKPR